MTGKPFTLIAVVIFALMALAHLYRLVTHFQIIVGSHTMPQWLSIVGFVVTGVLAWMVYRENAVRR
jgi:putative Ca2+/H+ antiporter (TMEM165/GDT1 family)